MEESLPALRRRRENMQGRSTRHATAALSELRLADKSIVSPLLLSHLRVEGDVPPLQTVQTQANDGDFRVRRRRAGKLFLCFALERQQHSAPATRRYVPTGRSSRRPAFSRRPRMLICDRLRPRRQGLAPLRTRSSGVLTGRSDEKEGSSAHPPTRQSWSLTTQA